MSTPTFSIIIPSWNNPQFLNPCIDSIIGTGVLNGLGELIIVNNGTQPVSDYVRGVPNIKVLEPKENLGWERGLALGLQHSTAPFVCFQNDDTHIPKASQHFYSQLLYPFQDQNVAAVGPSTTIASGWHSIFLKNALRTLTEVSYLIFFTVMMRRSDLDLAGGVDTTAPGGDDFDLSMRLRKMGKKLLVNPDAFLIHHGFKTGTRVRGDQNTSGGWNSKEMIDRTNQFLIQKHGFVSYIQTVSGLDTSNYVGDRSDREGEVIRGLDLGEKIYELGCGFRKTIPSAIGVDRQSAGTDIPHVPGGTSVADIIADVSDPLPMDDCSGDSVIARHILEHCLDSVQTLKRWNRVIRMGGKLVIAVPDESKLHGIPLNPEHVHAFTPDTLKSLAEVCGFKTLEFLDPRNGISFVGVFEKVLHVEHAEMKELVNA